mmetsp:Transcript_27236/g.41816  ORF Transcript_27236/g.41816 Transcript_27236/m.41816 type:complete len:140 (-) Transcript_27236:40-459(-)
MGVFQNLRQKLKGNKGSNSKKGKKGANVKEFEAQQKLIEETRVSEIEKLETEKADEREAPEQPEERDIEPVAAEPPATVSGEAYVEDDDFDESDGGTVKQPEPTKDEIEVEEKEFEEKRTLFEDEKPNSSGTYTCCGVF